MVTKKDQTIGFRLDSALKEALNQIALKETRSVSQQVEHFIKQGISNYIMENPNFTLPVVPATEDRQNRKTDHNNA